MNGINDLKVAHTRGSLGYLHEATAMSGKPPLMADASEASNDPMERKRRWTTISIYLASIVERADEQILPALYYFVGVSLGATPSQLGILTLARALVQAFTSPLSGVLGDTHDRGQIIAAGCCELPHRAACPIAWEGMGGIPRCLCPWEGEEPGGLKTGRYDGKLGSMWQHFAAGDDNNPHALG